MRRLRLRWRRPRGRSEYAAAGIVAIAATVLLFQMILAAWDEAARAWPVFAAVAAAGLVYGGWRMQRTARDRRAHTARCAVLRITLAEIDALDDQEFEIALRDLLIRDGWLARKVGQQGDQAADVIGQSAQRGRIVLQAKHTKVGGKVGSSVMYQVKGTAGPVHRADIAVVVTNGTFTRDAKAWGERHGIHWVDRDRLRTWAEYGTPLHQLLCLPNKLPRRAPGRRAAA
ncbi:restriction endonuclease [Streptomyces sp. NPDC002659]|uniref:restriction endonuclease n=1 Tax=Streptomyces sp. NPDC002659 TaxID=3364656 RepID=UPI00367F7297